MERIFYKSDYVYPSTELPVYIFDTSYLPPPELINYDALILTLVTLLPDEPYVLIVFSCGLNKVSWIWGVTFIKKLLADESGNLENLRLMITVHDSWFLKSITQIFSNFKMTKIGIADLNSKIESLKIFNGMSLFRNTPKFKRISCSTLSELSKYVDITRLKVSLNIYKHDLLLENKIHFFHPTVKLINEKTKVNQTLDPIFYHHFYQIFNIFDIYADKVELLFHKPGNKVNTDIFYNCINRNQILWINDWDLYCIATSFKRILMELPTPLIDVKNILLPVKNDLNYTMSIFQKIVNSYEDDSNYAQVLYQLCDLCNRIISNNTVTKHSSASLAKCLGHCISHELISSQHKDNILIINRFFKNVLDHWDQIQPILKHKYRTVNEISTGKEGLVQPDDSYDLSYDISTEENDQDEYRVIFNTTNILTSNSNLSNPRANPSSPTRKNVINTQISPKKINTKPSSKTLSDVSNISIQFPPQKYKVQRNPNSSSLQERMFQLSEVNTEENNIRKPVIRGRKVGALAKLFEDRSRGFELLNSM